MNAKVRWLVALALLLLAAVAGGRQVAGTPAQQEHPATLEAIILLDVTGSMRGEGPGARDIWDQVVEKVVEQLGSFSDGTQFAIVPFDAGPRHRAIWLNPPAQPDAPLSLTALDATTRPAAISYVRALVPDGQSTWICDAFEYTLRQLQASRAGHPAGTRMQAVFLYTDGLDNGKCAGNFATRMVEIFNAHTADFPFLYTAYIDLNEHLSSEAIATIGQGTEDRIRVNQGIPEILEIDPTSLALGNLATFPQGVEVTLRVKGRLPDSPPSTAAVAILPADLGLRVEPVSVTLAPAMKLTITAGKALDPRSSPATLRLQPAQDHILLANGGNVALTFSWQPPTPTPTPVPQAKVGVATEGDLHLGAVEAGSDQPLTGTRRVLLSFDAAARSQRSPVEVQALLQGEEQVDQFWLALPDGQRAARRVVPPDEATLTVGYRIDASTSGRFWPGRERRAATVSVSSPSALIEGAAEGAGTGQGDGAAFVFTYDLIYPFGMLHASLLATTVAALLLLGYTAFHCRFPADAAIVVQGGGRYPLRTLAERNLPRRLFGASLTMGTAGDDIDLGAGQTVARLTPRRTWLCFFGQHVLIAPTIQGQDAVLKLDGEPVTGVRELFPGATVATGGLPITYERGENLLVSGELG
ncbi:MAG: VWA domain-containing protein [Chloroflexi bacterium]|nr:VWA domain-containing protein [Chloroflexota bacterium]